MSFDNILLVTNHAKDPMLTVATSIVKRLLAHDGVSVFAGNRADAEMLGLSYSSELPDNISLMIVIGGDGSVLDASDIALEKNIPLIGINLGHLGYLAEVEVEELDILEKLFTDDVTLTERMTLELTVVRKNGDVLHCDRLGANEITLMHVEEFGLADLTMTDETGNCIRYHGDGLIVATPTGSTGYSFSAGGPILSPALENVCVTPICPHSFFNRSMILGSDAEIHVTNTTHHGEHVGVSVDGRRSYVLAAGDSVRIKASAKKLKTVRIGSHPTFNTLRRKMELAELKD